MTQDDMVKVARECGIGLAYGRESIERFYTFVAAAEREACAKVCEELRDSFLSPQYATGQPMSSIGERFAAGRCAEAIRARGEA